MSNHIEVKIDGNKVTPERFLEAVESFFALIQGVAKNVAQKPVDWVIEVDKGSAIVRAHVEHPSIESEQTIDVVCRGIRSLRSGVKVIPHGFTPNEVRASKRLASVVDGKDVLSVCIKNGGSTPEDFAPTIIPTANAILTGENHIAFGSIEGKIVSLSDRQGFSCSIYEPLYRREIVCYLQNPVTQEEAIEGFRKRARVLAGGLIHYAKEGYPVNITADTIQVFPAESELPSVEEIQEIYKSYK